MYVSLRLRRVICALSALILMFAAAVTPAPSAQTEATAVHTAEMKQGAADIEALVAEGEEVYGKVCSACHQPSGKGLAGVFPPLNDSDFLREDLNRAVEAVIKGLTGPIVVNGTEYKGSMPPMGYLKDEEIAAALTFVLQTWNGGGNVTVDQVTAARGDTGQAKHPVPSEEQHAYQGTPSAIAGEQAKI